MGIATAIIAAVGAIANYVSNEKGRKDANRAYAASAQEARQARSEDQALNAQKAAQERRRQAREERIARGRLMQQAENNGVESSSGESGAVAGLATQLGANIGFNLGQLSGTGRMNQNAQNAADYNFAAQRALSNAQGKAAGFSLASNIFSSIGSSGASAGG
jgi:hypothetical protein